MSQMLAAALSYAAKGIKVFPCWHVAGGRCGCGNPTCSSPGKHPLTDHGLKDATTDQEVIRRWFWISPEPNIAGATGGDFCAIDEDVAGSILELGIDLPNGPVARTGRPGLHYIFKAASRHAVPSRTKFAPGLDIKAAGGYVIMAPSLHASGRQYAWTPGHSLEDVPVPNLPNELVRLITAASGSNGAAPGERDLFGRLKIEALIEQLETMPPDGDWRGVMLKLIGSLIGRRLPDNLILSIARRGTRKDLGFDHGATDALVLDLISSTRRRWGVPPPGEDTFDQVDDECAKSELSEKSPWPDPLDLAALHGLAGDVVTLLGPHTEADPAALLVQFLAAFGNVCGRGHYLLVEGDRHPPQLWPVLVGRSSKARKGTSWGRLLQLFEAAAPYWSKERRMSGLSSGEGIVWQVRDRVVSRVKNKAGDYEEVEVDPGVSDKRLLVVESEWASPLRHMERQGNTLSSTLRCLWDRGDVGSLTKNSPARTTGAMISVIGHIVDSELKRYLTRTEMGNGLANRHLFVCVQRSKMLPFGGGEVELGEIIGRLADRLQRIERRGEQRILWTDGAREIWERVYSDLSADRPGLHGAVVSRAEAQALRLALTYALIDGKVFLEPEHLRAGLAVWRYCDQSAAYLFGGELGNPLADEIRRALVAAGSVGRTRTDIHNLFRRHQGRDALGQALELLEEQGLARRETSSTGGRPEERWFAQ